MPVPPVDVYDEHAEEFDDATGLDGLPDAFRDLLSSFVDGLAGPAVLDAGCGPGRDVEYFHDRGLDPVGVDVADGMLAYARENRPGRYVKMDASALGFPDDAFDGVWCPATVFFLPPAGMEAALEEFARVLRPDGVARIGFKLGDGRTVVEKWGETTVEYRVSEERARALVEAAGLGVGSVAIGGPESGATFANVRCRPVGDGP